MSTGPDDPSPPRHRRRLVCAIADIITAHCPATRAREDFFHACIQGDWYEAREMVEGILAEPQWLRGYQETRLLASSWHWSSCTELG
jgi:hypothetical protein